MNSFGNSSKSLANLALFKNFSWSNFLDGTQKTLGVINQAIPIVYQIKPVFNNARAIFRIADELNYNEDNTYSEKKLTSDYTNEENLPIFYI